MVRRVKRLLNKTSALALRGENFRQRYDDVERARVELLHRLCALEAKGHVHPAFKNAQTLLNQNFRRAKLGQRMAVLVAAEWIIDLLETMILFT